MSLLNINTAIPPTSPAARPAYVPLKPQRQQYLDLKAIVHRKLLDRLNLEALAQAGAGKRSAVVAAISARA